jgi:sec-independent protein translocase protein TatA
MIPALPQVGGTELLILLVIILLLFGAKRIPQLARSFGTGTREFRKGIAGDYDGESKQWEDVSSSEGSVSHEGAAPQG